MGNERIFNVDTLNSWMVNKLNVFAMRLFLNDNVSMLIINLRKTIKWKKEE